MERLIRLATDLLILCIALSFVYRLVSDLTSHDDLVGAIHRCPGVIGLDELRESGSVKLRWAFSSGTTGCSLPAALAVSASRFASASRASLAFRIFFSRLSRKASSRDGEVDTPALHSGSDS